MTMSRSKDLSLNKSVKDCNKYNIGLSILFFRRMTLDDSIEPESKFVCIHYLKDHFLIFCCKDNTFLRNLCSQLRIFFKHLFYSLINHFFCVATGLQDYHIFTINTQQLNQFMVTDTIKCIEFSPF